MGQVVTLTGSELPDLIIGNKKDYHISGGKGEDHLYGREGKDVYVIKQGDGMNYIYQMFDDDKNIDTPSRMTSSDITIWNFNALQLFSIKSWLYAKNKV